MKIRYYINEFINIYKWFWKNNYNKWLTYIWTIIAIHAPVINIIYGKSILFSIFVICNWFTVLPLVIWLFCRNHKTYNGK